MNLNYPQCIENSYFHFVHVSILPICMHRYMNAWCMHSEEGIDPLELELQVVLSYHAVVRN